ncbi:MAG: SDR family NAD(P)-dependent oxidoreductase, partial [Betaproteobacteria bacterium PRO3]|nr:SDR family NAD(P)-dependent oxidoreductase [Betaproteobacteria bacterium PRO3]
TLAAMLVDEAQADTDATLVALRAGRRAEERLYALPEPPRGPRPRLREGGVVLVTGGTGGLGLLFAEALFDACRARLVLTARWQPPPESEWPERARGGDRIARALARVLALRARGADVTIVRADVGSRTDLAAVLDAVRERHGELHGVVHAAGTSSRELVLQRTAGNAADVLAPKAVGALHLDELLGDAPLDLYLPVSSTATQTPLPGQFDYAAANAVLDALAANRAERHGGVACAIGWGPWQEVGIAVDRLRESLEASQARERERAAGLETTPLDHPILRERERLQGERHCYRGSLRRGMWVVDDHRLDGRPILSGTTTLQLVTTAFRDHAGGDGAVELNDVVFRRPLFTAGPGMDLEIRFEPSGADERFELASRTSGGGGVFEVNATGFARKTAVPPSIAGLPPEPGDWAAVPRARDFGGARLSGGPRWGWRRWEREDGEFVRSRIVLPDAFLDDLPVYDLHPALLDAATQGLRGVGAEVVPYTYDAVRVHAPLEREIYAHTSKRRAGDETVHDIVVTNGSGSVLVELEGFLVRRIAGSNLGERPEVTNGAARRVVVTEPGNLDSLALEPFEPPLPGPGEVLVEVRATGLNFRDVLTALGQMPRAHEGPYVPGSEASGVVRAVGAGVTRLAVGDAVVTIARSALATHVLAPAHATVAMPSNLDFERAAGLPIVFLTACHALEDLARLQRGERVLIHAGAGGVGLAAIQVARALHARVFATAGSEDKRAYLRTLGVEAVFDSRSLDFVEGVREATGGEGVDVVLNSLAGEFIPASLSVLAPEGRFVEIGKRDLLADANLALAPFLRNLTFSAFDLGQMVDRAHPRLPAMFDTLMDRFARGELTPPPTAIVPLDTAGEGFRRMARAKHVGKIVFAVDREAAARGELARAFESNYGEGVPVAWGLDVFRRSLNWLGAPPFVLATGRTSDVANLEARSRPAAEAQRGRDGLATAYRPPGTPVERALVALWERTLGFEPVGIDDDFVDLGGDSIESIQVLHAILRDFGLRIRNTDFLAAPTIAQLASRIEAARAGSPEAQEASVRAEREAP